MLLANWRLPPEMPSVPSGFSWTFDKSLSNANAKISSDGKHFSHQSGPDNKAHAYSSASFSSGRAKWSIKMTKHNNSSSVRAFGAMCSSRCRASHH